MDNSQEYISMCSAASKLRMLWVPAVGDFYFSKHKSDTGVYVVTALPHSRSSHVWLPRIDQLLLLVETQYNVPKKAPYALNQFMQYILSTTPSRGDTVEQLLIQFVMHKLFNQQYLLRSWIPVRGV